MLAGMWYTANTQSLLIAVVYSMWLAYNYTCTSTSGVLLILCILVSTFVGY